jgi:hypothetical protein
VKRATEGTRQGGSDRMSGGTLLGQDTDLLPSSTAIPSQAAGMDRAEDWQTVGAGTASNVTELPVVLKVRTC